MFSPSFAVTIPPFFYLTCVPSHPLYMHNPLVCTYTLFYVWNLWRDWKKATSGCIHGKVSVANPCRSGKFRTLSKLLWPFIIVRFLCILCSFFTRVIEFIFNISQFLRVARSLRRHTTRRGNDWWINYFLFRVLGCWLSTQSYSLLRISTYIYLH